MEEEALEAEAEEAEDDEEEEDEDDDDEALEASEDDEAAATDGARAAPFDATLFPKGLGATFQLCTFSLLSLRSSPSSATRVS